MFVVSLIQWTITFNYPYLCTVYFQVNSFVGAFHDAVILYALALNETLADGYNATDGAEITKRMWNRSFEGKYIYCYWVRSEKMAPCSFS